MRSAEGMLSETNLGHNASALKHTGSEYYTVRIEVKPYESGTFVGSVMERFYTLSALASLLCEAQGTFPLVHPELDIGL